MLLGIDVGNTEIEFGWFENDRLQKSWRIATGVNRTEDEFMVFVHHFLALSGIRITEVKAVAISSVVPTVTRILTKLCRKYLNLEPLIVDHTLNLGIKINYANPANVGADRICNAVAAYQRYRQACIVIDLGTATTFDVINQDGEYLGGLISPGLETTSWALAQRAAKLPKINLEFPESAIGRNTEESMKVGIMLGAVKMIDGLVEEILNELQQPCRVIATGGLARLIQPRTKYVEEYVSDLVLLGLYQIYQMNSHK
ncbi:MAG: type III pantothenate kinase [Calditrichia bacterium]